MTSAVILRNTIELTNIAGAENDSTRHDRAVVIRFPAHRGEDLAERKGYDTPASVENAVAAWVPNCSQRSIRHS